MNPHQNNLSKVASFPTNFSLIILTSTLAFVGMSSSAHSAILWSSQSDPHNDSHASDGSNVYEIYKGGFGQDDDFVYFALDTNLPITGRNTDEYVGGYRVPDQNIGWGDLFFDPDPGDTYKDGLDTRRMIGIKFSPNNDSKVSTQGVHLNASGTSVAKENAGFWNLRSHNIAVGGNSRLGALAPNDPYYSSYYIPGVLTPSVIESGDYIGGISTLNRQDLLNLGFGGLQGSESFGIQISKDLLPTGDFIATFLQECLNEGFAISGNIPEPPDPPKPVPESSSTILSLVVSACAFLCHRYKLS
jgi:hypothetical protein